MSRRSLGHFLAKITIARLDMALYLLTEYLRMPDGL